MNEAIEHLRNCQRQLDRDGVEVGVSRQALDETLDELEQMRSRIRALEAAVKLALDQSQSGLRHPRTGKLQEFEDTNGERLWFITDDAITALNAVKASPMTHLNQDIEAAR